MADGCCGGEAAAPAEIVVGAEVSVERSWLPAWPITAAAGAAVTWFAGVIVEAAGRGAAATVLFVVAVVVGGFTFVGGHEILPVGGHEIARWWPTVLPAGGQWFCPR